MGRWVGGAWGGANWEHRWGWASSRLCLNLSKSVTRGDLRGGRGGSRGACPDAWREVGLRQPRGSREAGALFPLGWVKRPLVKEGSSPRLLPAVRFGQEPQFDPLRNGGSEPGAPVRGGRWPQSYFWKLLQVSAALSLTTQFRADLPTPFLLAFPSSTCYGLDLRVACLSCVWPAGSVKVAAEFTCSVPCCSLSAQDPGT